MESGIQIQEQAGQLVDAVTLTMNPDVDQKRRSSAYETCESFKETSPYCVECGAILNDTKHPPYVRHFGLQLLEHFVRFKWNDARVEQKVHFKEMFSELIRKQSSNIFEEENYIKEAHVKIMVEMIKREWPQQWPSLLSELDQMQQMGDCQTEIVLLILLRLVEDVVTFKNFQNQRRKDLWQALTANMKQIFTFLVMLLQTHSSKYEMLQNSSPNTLESNSACKVTQCVLLTLSGFVEWVDFKHLFEDDNRLLIILYQLLRNDELKIPAAECLQLIVNRKGKIEERKPLLVLLCESAMAELFNAAVKACNAGINEQNHSFVKKLCQVITGLGLQLCAISATEGEKFQKPGNLGSYLKTLFAFTQHASIHVCFMTSSSWMMFLRHEQMSQDPAMLEIIPSLSQNFTSTLQKVGFPSRNDSPACAYSRVDFDSDDEFFHFFANHRHYQLEILRHATSFRPETTFSIAARWLQELLAAPLEREEGKELCTSHCPSYVKWDALTGYLDSVMTTLIKNNQLPVQQTMELLRATLDSKTEDPMILSCQLTCISTLFPVLYHAKEYVERVLDKLFSAAVYSLPGLTKKTRTRSVQNVRRHACSAMVKISRDHQDLMLPHFEKIYTRVQMLSSDPEQLTQLERVTLNESLILINNGLHDFSRQSALVAEITKPVAEVLQSPTISLMIQSPGLFIHQIGLDQPSSGNATQEDVHNRNRAQVLNCISMSQAAVKRSCWPTDPQVAEAGGFVGGHLPNGSPIYKNPSTPHIMPLLPSFFTLIRTLNAMWTPECRAKTCPEYTKSYDMTENEKNTILGLLANSTEVPSNKPVVERVQIFLTVIYETMCHLFSDCFQSLGCEFYSAEGLADHLLGSVFSNLHHLPDYRLKHVIRVVGKSCAQFCPRECWESVLIPVMTGLCTYMVHRLNQQWTLVLQRKESNNGQEEQDEEQESQEVVQDHLLRTVTKEFMELIGLLCWNKTPPPASAGGEGAGSETKEGGGGDLEMETEEGATHAESGAAPSLGGRADQDTISELGKVVLQNERLCESLVTCVYSAMSWPDTGVCIKACRLSWLLLQQVASRQLLPEAVTQLFTSILRGLQVHGEHDTCMTELVLRALQHYDLLREKYPVLTSVMTSLPGCTEQAMQQFHQRTLGAKNLSEKKKKDGFKKLLQGIIGQNIGQKFKKNEVIRNLPAIYKPVKPKRSLVETSVDGEDTGLVALFAAASSDL